MIFGKSQITYFVFGISSVLISLIVSKICIEIFNIIPAKWLCEYNEKPNDELFMKRLFMNPHGIIITIGLTLSYIFLYFQYNGYNFYFYMFYITAVILFLISISDCKYFIIPNQFTFILLILAAVTVCYDNLSGKHIFYSDFISSIYGGLCGLLIMLTLASLGKLQFKKEAMGLGDVKLFSVIGTIVGFPHIFIIFLLTIFSSFFYILYLLIRRRLTKGLYIPLGPYMCFSLLVFLLFHKQLDYFIGWYLSLFNI